MFVPVETTVWIDVIIDLEMILAQITATCHRA